jgi:hypothetical protein
MHSAPLPLPSPAPSPAPPQLPSWTASVFAASSRTRRSEITNAEGVQSWHMAENALWVMLNGTEYLDAWPAMSADALAALDGGFAAALPFLVGVAGAALDVFSKEPPPPEAAELLAQHREPTLSELARFARMGRRAARRLLVPLLQSGLIAETDRHRLWLTPLGHRSA